MTMQKTRLVQESVRLHIETVLIAAGYTDAADWVVIGRVQPKTMPPVVAVAIPTKQHVTYETGSDTLATYYFCDVEIHAEYENEMRDIEDTIVNNLSAIEIIDFNQGFPGDIGYDADAQNLAHGDPKRVQSSVIDDTENTAKISFQLLPNKPIVI